MRGDINFKGSDSSDLSVYFLFCDPGLYTDQLQMKRIWVLGEDATRGKRLAENEPISVNLDRNL